jgi:hypothetical protein
MRFRLFVAATLIAVSLTSCATSARYNEILSGWVGGSESELVEKWAPPQSIYEFEGTRHLTYIDQRTIIVPGAAPTYRTSIVGNTAYTNSYGDTSPIPLALRCQTTFKIRNATVVGWSVRGNNCVAD